MKIYVLIPQGMNLQDGATKSCGMESEKGLALQPVKRLYGLKKIGRLWSRLLHDKLEEAGFTRYMTACTYTQEFRM